MAYRRDPVSVYYTRMASAALGRAWRRRGRWLEVPVPQMSSRASVACLRAGIDPYGTDGRGTSRSVRGMVRALYYMHRASDASDVLVWEDLGGALGGWKIRIMRAPRGDPRLPAPAPAWGYPPTSPAAATSRDWPQR